MLNNKELISVIIPVYNTKDYLESCLESVINQSYENLEIILVDDGSTDGSSNLCEQFSREDSRIKVIHTVNEGTSAARNKGIQQAGGKYLGFIDSDDYIRKDFYEKLVNKISDDNDIVSCGVDIMHPDGRVMRQSTPKVEIKYYGDEIIRELLINTTYFNFSMCNKIFRRELFGGVEFPIGKKHEEILVMYEIAKRSKKLTCLNEAMYYYTVREGSNSRHPFNLSNMYMAEATLAIYEDVKQHYKKYTDIALYRHMEYVLFLIEWIEDAEEDFIDVKNQLINHIRRYSIDIYESNYISDDLKARMLLVAWKDKNRVINKCYENSIKYLENTRVLNELLEKKQKGLSIIDYFKKNNIKNIAIYGMSHLGQRFREELRNSDINIKYVIDKNVKDTFSDLKIISPDDDFEPVDMIVVTAVYYYENIKNIVEHKGKYNVISLKKIIKDM